MKNAFFCHFFRFCQQWMCCFLECFHLCIKLQQQKANVSPSKSNVTHSNGSSTPLCSYCLSKCLTRLLLCDDLHLCCCVFVQPSSGCCKNSPFSLSFDWLSWLSLSLFCMSTHIRDFHILLFFFFFVFWEMQHWRVLRVRLPLSVSSDSKRMLGGDFFFLCFFFPSLRGKTKHQLWVFTWQNVSCMWARPLVCISCPACTEKALSEECCTHGVNAWMLRLWLVFQKMDDYVWCS